MAYSRWNPSTGQFQTDDEIGQARRNSMLGSGQTAPPAIEDYLYGLEEPQLDTTQEPAFQQGRGGAFLEGLAGLNTVTRAPRNFGEGLIGGFSKGLGNAGTRIAIAHEKFDRAATMRQAARDEANLGATRRWREEKSRRAYEYGKDQRTAAQRASADAADYARGQLEKTPGTVEYRNAITRAREMGAAGRAPAGAGDDGPLVAIEGPDGNPVLVPRSQASGKRPARTQSSEKPRRPTAAQLEHATIDTDMLSQMGRIRSAMGEAPGQTGPLRGPVLGALQAVGISSSEGRVLRQRVAALKNQVLKARSGGAVTEGEAARLLEELPTDRDPDNNLLTKLNEFENTYRIMATSRRQNLEASGVDVSGLVPLPGGTPAGAAAESSQPAGYSKGGFFDSNRPGTR